MDIQRLKQIIEGALMVSEKPLGVDQLGALFELRDEQQPTREEVRTVLGELQQEYQDRGIELIEVAGGYRFQSRADSAPWLNRLWEEKTPRYSRALLETLAIIAYRQPITRGEIESIRGVAVSTGIVRTLLEREWARVVGHRDVPGRPAVYATTREFLDYFNLKSLSNLPSLAELKDFDDLNADLFEDRSPVGAGDDETSTPDGESHASVDEDEEQEDRSADLDADDSPESDIAAQASSGMAAAAFGPKPV